MELRSSETQRLQDAVRAARDKYVNARRKYETALLVAADTKLSSDATTGLRIASQEYRRSLERYSAAVNRWAEHLRASVPKDKGLKKASS